MSRCFVWKIKTGIADCIRNVWKSKASLENKASDGVRNIKERVEYFIKLVSETKLISKIYALNKKTIIEGYF